MLSKRNLAVAVAALFCSGAFASPTTSSVDIGQGSSGISIDPVLGTVFVTNGVSGTVSTIDVAKMAVADSPAGTAPRRVIADAATHRLYLANDTTPGSVTVIDEVSKTILATIPVGDRPRSIAADFQKHEVYVANRDSNSVSVIDTDSNTIKATVNVGHRPSGIDVDPLRGRVYITNVTDNTVSVLEQGSGALLQTITVGRSPSFPTVDQRTGKVYVNNIDDRNVTVLSPDGNVLTTLPAGANSTFGAVSAVFHRYYLPNAGSGTITVIDTGTDRVVNTIQVGVSPQNVAVDNVTERLYVPNRMDDAVSVIDARTEAVVATVLVGMQPWRAVTGMGKVFVLNENADRPDSVTVIEQDAPAVPTAIVTEFYDKNLDHYFNTSSGPEVRLIGDGKYDDDWKRTMQFWRVWTEPAGGRVPVCRFFSTGFGAKSSHFFTPRADECALLRSGQTWQFESLAYYVAPPDPNGNCSSDTVPLYRLYNNGMGGAPAHRLTTDAEVREAMEAQGWTSEGDGNDKVIACVPPLV